MAKIKKAIKEEVSIPDIKQIDFPGNQYVNEKTNKSQIYLHHTAGGPNAENVFFGWSKTGDRVATCVVIARDGSIVQGFSSELWAYHLGLNNKIFNAFNLPYQSLDKTSIGIEICNWGQLTLKGGKYYNYVNREVPTEEVCKLETPFKGYTYFQNYTDAQIESVKNLLLYWNDKYGIPLDFNMDIFDLNQRALSGKPGIYTHNSVRRDKVDIYPYPKMIEMLLNLKK